MALTEQSIVTLLAVDDIVVKDRRRKDLGDLTGLRESIAENDLINPITVAVLDGEYRLIAGERRLEATKALGCAFIKAHIVERATNARDLLVIERDENTMRKPMLKSELAAMAMAIEELEKPKARERMRAGGQRGGQGLRQVTHPLAPVRATVIAAEAVGLSEPTYRRLKQARTTASDETEAPEIRAVAQAALDEIDGGAPVAPQVKRINDKRRELAEAVELATPPATDAPIPGWADIAAEASTYASPEDARTALAPETGIDYFRARMREHGVTWDVRVINRRTTQANEVVERAGDNVLGAVEAAAEAFDVIDTKFIDPETAAEALSQLEAAVPGIRKLIKLLKGIK